MGQGLSINFVFVRVHSKNKQRCQDYVGVNGKTYWILVTDHFTGMQFGATQRSKASPIKWLRQFLVQ